MPGINVEIGRFTSEDTYPGEFIVPQSQNPYVYVINNPLKYVDSTGNWAESLWDVGSLLTGAASFVSSVKKGDIFGAVVDGVGILADGAALVLPVVPGGAGYAIKAARATSVAADVADVVGGGREIVQGLESGNNLQTGIGVLQATFGVGGIGKSTSNLFDNVDEINNLFTGDVKLLTGDATGYLDDGIVGAEYGGVNIGDLGSSTTKRTSKTVDDILDGATQSRVTKGRSSIYEKVGDYDDALKDFYSLNPDNIIDIDIGKVGTLDDGRTVIVRTKSTDGRITLEIQNGKNKIKIRYSK